MSTTPKTKAPRLTWAQAMAQAQAEQYTKASEKAIAKARRRGQPVALMKVRRLPEVTAFEALGWEIHTFQPSATYSTKYWMLKYNLLRDTPAEGGIIIT